ncbi:D-arabinono-1,4-lactone oxidase [Nocardia flavorosea]|uniref:D-arabinono-1,4-lactone oxidase n=1 Tax=Nocardia flavorosea TaxID=53429 RepID=UPI002456EE85|nr:D-arabinono-1,4-lactone oxidase [Nocardia flavorosea]
MTKLWVNWAGDQQCVPARLAAPRDHAELADELGRAAADGHRVRVAGSGHSFTGACLTDGLLLDLSRMNRVLEVDRETGLAKVQAGMTLAALNDRLDQYGLAFPNLGDIDAQTIAGATATGTHGTGARLPNLSAQLHGVELMTADGRTVELTEHSGAEAWRAARVSVGALGVITAFTLQLVPSFVLEGVERPVPVAEILDDLDSYVDGNEHFEFYMFAHSPLAMTKRNNRVDLPPAPRHKAVDWFADIAVSNHVSDALCRLARRRPAVIPPLQRAAAYAFSYRRQVDRSYRVFTSPRLFRFTEMEYAIPREHSVEAIREIKETARRFDSPMPIEVRWVAGDDAFLSPAGGRATCYIAVHQYEGMEHETFFRACETVFDRYQGRPHWGKRHYQSAETLRARYPDWDRFAAVRRHYDPGGRFANDYLDGVLGPV